jgi:hypothetical protein
MGTVQVRSLGSAIVQAEDGSETQAMADYAKPS